MQRILNKLETYTASDVVSVDDETRDFIENADAIAQECERLEAEDLKMSLEREMFTMGSNDFLQNSLNSIFYKTSNSYFLGFNFVKNLNLKEEINHEAERLFPKPMTTPYFTAHQYLQFQKNVSFTKID